VRFVLTPTHVAALAFFFGFHCFSFTLVMVFGFNALAKSW